VSVSTCAFVAGTGCNAENLTSQSPSVLSAPELFKKEKRGVEKESYYTSIFEDAISKTELINLLLPRIKAFSTRVLKEQKREWGGGESYLILGSDIMEFERHFRPLKIEDKMYEN
jgi:hypothetical protein